MAGKTAKDSRRIELIRPTVSPSDFLPTSEQKSVIDSTSPRLIVIGGPGTGKSATLIETVVSQIKSGFDPNSILVLTYGRERDFIKLN